MLKECLLREKLMGGLEIVTKHLSLSQRILVMESKYAAKMDYLLQTNSGHGRRPSNMIVNIVLIVGCPVINSTNRASPYL